TALGRRARWLAARPVVGGGDAGESERARREAQREGDGAQSVDHGCAPSAGPCRPADQGRAAATSAALRCAAISSASSRAASVTGPWRRSSAQPRSRSASQGFFGRTEPWQYVPIIFPWTAPSVLSSPLLPWPMR